MRIKLKIFGRLMVGAALSTAMGFCAVTSGYGQSSAAIQSLENVRQVSMLSADNNDPALAFSPDGAHLFVTWDGSVNGNRRIFLREQVAGEWLKPVIVDSNPAGDNRFPSIAVDNAGVPHLSWVSTVDGIRQPMYARRLSRFPNRWYQQTIPFPTESTVTGNCDFVNLQLDKSDHPWIVWQYGFGNVYSVACTRYSVNGELESTELTPGATTHNLYPELFFLPEPTVYWYLAQSDQFYLIGSKWDKPSGQWRVALPENLENIPADNLPDLFLTSRGPLAAIWYDRQQTGSEASSDRIFLGVQSEETHGGGEVIDQQPNAGNHSVTGTAPHGKFITAWVSETYAGGANIYLGMGNSPDTISSVKMSDDSAGMSGNPKVAGSADRAAVAWESKSGVTSKSSEIVVRIADLAQ